MLNDYLVTWTDIYGRQKTDHVKLEKPTEDHAVHAIPHRGDIFKKIDKIESAIWDDESVKFVPATKPYSHSKVPVYEGDSPNFTEYSCEFVPNQGEMTFDEAHATAVSLLKKRPGTVLNKSSDGSWWVGEMDNVTKKAYFQGGGGVNEPTPGKKKYKSDKAIVVQPRFKEPFYRNYDVYMTEGVDGPPKLGPGAGWHHMHEYKSISEFLDAKRKYMEDKYKAEDSWIEDTEANRKERIEKMKTRAQLLSRIVKIAQRNYDLGTGLYENMDKYKSVSEFLGDENHIDFSLDDQIGQGSILGDSESYNTPIQLGPEGTADTSISPGQVNLGDFESYPASAQIGGMGDKYLTNNDFEGKSPVSLDFGRDYTEDADPQELDEDTFEKLIKKYLTSPPPGLYGLPDGVDLPDEDLGDPTNINPDYGTTDVGITMYEDKWNI